MSYNFGDIHNTSTEKQVNIHDLLKMNNVKRGHVDFDTELDSLEKILSNVIQNTEYTNVGILDETEEQLINILRGDQPKTEFVYPQTDALYLTNKNQNEYLINLTLNGTEMQKQFAKLNYIDFQYHNIDIKSINISDSQFANWNLQHIGNRIILSDVSDNDNVIPILNVNIDILEIEYEVPVESWSREIRIDNIKIESSIVEHIITNTRITIIPNITGDDVYSYNVLSALAGNEYINDNIRAKPTTHSQQDNMFIIFQLDEFPDVKQGDIIFCVDNSLLYNTDSLKMTNYICGWTMIEDPNELMFIGVYYDSTHNSNENFRYKYYDSNTKQIFDIDALYGSVYNTTGYGTKANKVIFTKSNESVVISEINGEQINNIVENILNP